MHGKFSTTLTDVTKSMSKHTAHTPDYPMHKLTANDHTPSSEWKHCAQAQHPSNYVRLKPAAAQRYEARCDWMEIIDNTMYAVKNWICYLVCAT